MCLMVKKFSLWKDIFVGIFNRILGSVVEKSFKNDAERLLLLCKSFSSHEITGLKVSICFALTRMLCDTESVRSGRLSLVLNLMESGERPTAAESWEISQYNLYLMDLQKLLHRSDSLIHEMTASGIPVWILSNRAVMNRSLMPYANEVWHIAEKADSLQFYDLMDAAVAESIDRKFADILSRSMSMGIPPLFQST